MHAHGASVRAHVTDAAGHKFPAFVVKFLPVKGFGGSNRAPGIDRNQCCGVLFVGHENGRSVLREFCELRFGNLGRYREHLSHRFPQVSAHVARGLF